MRALEKNYLKRGHHSNKHRNKHLNKHTSRLLDQLGPEGRVGENLGIGVDIFILTYPWILLVGLVGQ
jgi:hypothetical protein